MLCIATEASSATVGYVFDLVVSDVEIGAVDPGTAFSGSFLIDGASGNGVEEFAPESSALPGLAGSLLSLEMTIQGVSFSREDDVDFPNYPVVSFLDGQFESIEFISESFDPELFIDSDGFMFAQGPLGAEADLFSGTVENVQVIPLPAMYPVFALAVAGLGLLATRTRQAR